MEGDGSAAGWRDDTRAFSSSIAGSYTDIHNKIDWIATLTGRLGFAANNWLVYGKGGAAWAGTKGTAETYTGAGALAVNSSFADTRTGWTVGVGTEYAFSNNWSAKLEYNCIDLGRKTSPTTNVSTPAFGGGTILLDRDRENRIHLVKLGINYRFNFGGPSVIAKY
nr:outer membrane beta-barrel protein [Bradyrhizobium sediminis]